MVKRLTMLGLVAVVVVVGLVVGACGSGDEASESAPPSEVTSGSSLELSLGQGDSMASCLAFDVGVLAGMSPAFAATVTDVNGDAVTLRVDRWYTGGDVESVTLLAPAGLEALIDGFDFEVGEQYLITAADGNVNYCGYSGLATPELTAAFDEAFGD